MSIERSELLLLVTGAPASGKTTLALPLAEHLGLPLLSKDDVKEALLDSLGVGDRAWSRRLSDASYAVLLATLERQSSVVVDATFGPEHAGALEALGRRAVQIFCDCPRDVIERRLEVRAGTRAAGHLDEVLLEELRSGTTLRGSEPPPLTMPLVRVATSGPVVLNAVLDEVFAHLGL